MRCSPACTKRCERRSQPLPCVIGSTGIGVIPLGSAPAEFKPFIAAQVKQVADIVRAAGIEPQ